MNRYLKIPLVGLGLLLLSVHLRLSQQTRVARGRTSISTEAQLRRITHDIFQREGSLDHALTLNFAIDLREATHIELAREIKITGGPIAFDVLERPVPLEVHVNGGRTEIDFAPPPPAFGAMRQVTIAFTTAAPRPTYGWSYRAAALPWATTLGARSVNSTVQAHVNGATSAPGWRCTADHTGSICAIDVRRRSTIAVPIERFEDGRYKLLLALVIGSSISALMVAIYRRWSAHADRMGMPDEAPTLDEFVAEYRRRPRTPPAEVHADEIEPLEAVALVARGITAVLGLIASVFFMSHFEGGFFPIPAPLALTVWSALAGATVVTAVGLRRSRPWVSLAMIVGWSIVALHPAARFILPGIPPLVAAAAMQLTARQS